jgi:hypothetical protein
MLVAFSFFLKKKKQKFSPEYSGKRCPEQSRGAVCPGSPKDEDLGRRYCFVLCKDTGGAVFSLAVLTLNVVYYRRKKGA